MDLERNLRQAADARNRGSDLVFRALTDRLAARLGREACEELVAELRLQLESRTAQEDPDTRLVVRTYLANFEKALRSRFQDSS